MCVEVLLSRQHSRRSEEMHLFMRIPLDVGRVSSIVACHSTVSDECQDSHHSKLCRDVSTGGRSVCV